MQLRSYQEEAADSPIEYYKSGKQGNCVIAMPTGTGKSVVQASIIQRIVQGWQGQRILALTHVKTLIQQNVTKMQQLWSQAPVGTYSAGLKQRDTLLPIIFGGCGSVVKCVEKFGHRDILLIDEAHLLSPKANTTYQLIIDKLKLINPYVKTIGLTATPFRMGQGMITDGGIFTDICCDMTGVEAFNRFIAEGYLAPLYARPTHVQRSSDVMQRGASGDFSAAALEADAADKTKTYQALVEACEIGTQCNSWLVFASTIDDAEYITEVLNSFGIVAASYHSRIPAKELDRRMKAYQAGLIRCLVNQDMLTTGFDHPPLDLIIMLRRTMSPGLWVQMLGRGTRPSPETGKKGCFVLDFAGNTRRLGPINDPHIPKKKGKGGGEAPVRICPECGTYNHAAARVCIFCGIAFTFQDHIIASASTEEIIRSDLPVVELFDVTQIFYNTHNKAGSPPQLKIEYVCSGGLQRFTEYIQLEHEGFVAKKARDWWRQRFPGDYVPDTTEQALQATAHLRIPKRIRVWINKRFPEVLGYEY